MMNPVNPAERKTGIFSKNNINVRTTSTHFKFRSTDNKKSQCVLKI